MTAVVTVKFGIGNSVSRNAGEYLTVQDVINDPTVKEFLGYGDSIKVTRDGVEANMQCEPRDGDVYEVSTRSGEKGA